MDNYSKKSLKDQLLPISNQFCIWQPLTLQWEMPGKIQTHESLGQFTFLTILFQSNSFKLGNHHPAEHYHTLKLGGGHHSSGKGLDRTA